MKKYLLIGLIIGTVAIATGCGAKEETPAPQPQTPTTQTTPAPAPAPSTPAPTTTATATGKDVYDKNCAGCHGAAGAGGSAEALKSEKNLAETIAIVKNGKEAMTGYTGKLSDAEIQAVSQYVADLKK